MTWGRGSTRAWRTLRAQILKRDPACRIGDAGCTVVSTEVDHIANIECGGTDNPDNLRGVCHSCHQRKTKREATAGRSHRRQPTRKHPGIV